MMEQITNLFAKPLSDSQFWIFGKNSWDVNISNIMPWRLVRDCGKIHTLLFCVIWNKYSWSLVRSISLHYFKIWDLNLILEQLETKFTFLEI